jgi:hypothetical protein
VSRCGARRARCMRGESPLSAPRYPHSLGQGKTGVRKLANPAAHSRPPRGAFVAFVFGRKAHPKMHAICQSADFIQLIYA